MHRIDKSMLTMSHPKKYCKGYSPSNCWVHLLAQFSVECYEACSKKRGIHFLFFILKQSGSHNPLQTGKKKIEAYIFKGVYPEFSIIVRDKIAKFAQYTCTVLYIKSKGRQYCLRSGFLSRTCTTLVSACGQSFLNVQLSVLSNVAFVFFIVIENEKEILYKPCSIY
jgi:hypothetical protein